MAPDWVSPGQTKVSHANTLIWRIVFSDAVLFCPLGVLFAPEKESSKEELTVRPRPHTLIVNGLIWLSVDLPPGSPVRAPPGDGVWLDDYRSSSRPCHTRRMMMALG